MTALSALSSIRIIPRESDFLDRKLGSRGEIFFDQASSTLRLYDGVTTGGIPLLRADLSNAEAVIGAALGDAPPTGSTVQAGTIWFNTSNGRLYIYYNDGTSTQWVQPTTPSYGAAGGGGATTIDELSDVTLTSPSAGQVLKYNGTAWVNGTDNTGGGGGAGATNLDELTDVVISSPSATQVLKYNGTAWVNSTEGSYTLPTATSSTLGGVKIDNTTIVINGSGVISAIATASTFSGSTDATTASLTVDKIYLPAITMLNVTNFGATAYLFDQYTGNNPAVYAISGTTIAFNLQATGHPFLIQDSAGNDYNTGLTHVTNAGVVTTGSAAQGKTSGTLYWKIPLTTNGNYRYQCSDHAAMVGVIIIKNFASI
jgi:plastocyanin